VPTWTTRISLIQVLEDEDTRVLDLSSVDEIMKLTRALGDKLIAFLEEKGHQLERVAFLAIPRNGLIVPGYLSYLMNLTKYQVAPLLTCKAVFSGATLCTSMPAGSLRPSS